jgi:hypothetical protein
MGRMKMTITLCREIDVPAEIELALDVEIDPGSNGYFDPATGDCDPPCPASVDVNNLHEALDAMAAWFDHQKAENLAQLERYLDSQQFVDYVMEEASDE